MVWKTKSQIPKDRLGDLQTALRSGKFAQDPTFKWKIEDLTLVVESTTQDIGHRRGMWFIHRFDSRMRYTVEESKDADASCQADSAMPKE